MISLKQLRHLTVIAEQTNMHKAAEILHITQPALTRSLNTLEGLLNVRLFDRHSGGMRATPFCTEIVDKCQQILLDVEDIQRAARLLHDVEEGELNVGVGRGVGELVLRNSIPEFVLRHPNIRITVVEGTHDDLTRGLEKRDFDFLVIGLGSYQGASGLRKEFITNVPLSVIARTGHPLQAGKNLSLSQLTQYSLMSPTSVGSEHPLALAVVDANPELILPHIICGDYPTLISTLLCSDCVLISSAYNCESELRQGLLVALDVTHPALNTELGIIEIDKRSRSPAAEAFMTILVTAMVALD
jgi:DNA-binding transcriptional LysR family regulator